MSLLDEFVGEQSLESSRSTLPAPARPVSTPPTGPGNLRAVRARAAVDRLRRAVRRTGTSGVASGRRILRLVTPLGSIALASAAVLFLVSRWAGWQEFGVAAVALVAAFAAATIFTLGRASYKVELDLRSQRVVVGERASGRMVVTNVAGRRSLPVRMELPVGNVVAAVGIPGLGSRAEHEELFLIPTNRRAVLQVGPARSVRGDAFGLLRRVIRWTEPELLYVHPRTVPLYGSNPGFIKDLEGQATKELSNNDVSFHALRGYVPGDDRRYIHWKTSARTGVLMVRQFEETRRAHLAVALSTHLGEYSSGAEFELAVEACASLALQSFKEERDLTVMSGLQALKAPTARTLLDLMSGIEVSPAGAGVIEVSRHAASAVAEVSVAVVVCGAVPSPAEIRSATAAFPIGVRVIALRVVEGAAVAVRKIGAAPVVTIGRLEDLGRALRAVRA